MSTRRRNTPKGQYPASYLLTASAATRRNGSARARPEAILENLPLTARATVTNVGNKAGDEVVQLYVTDVEASARVPVRSLQGVKRIHLGPASDPR